MCVREQAAACHRLLGMRLLAVLVALLSACSSPASPLPAIRQATDCGTFVAGPAAPYDATGTDCFWGAYQAGRAARWSVTSFTTEGDPIPATITFTPARGAVVTRDVTADNFSSPPDRRLWTYRCTTLVRRSWAIDPAKHFFELSGCAGDGPRTSFPG